MTLSDGSGLSRQDRVPAARARRACSAAPPTAASATRPRLLSGLPVAGYDGTLADRGDADPATAARARCGPRPARCSACTRWPARWSTPTAGCSPSPSLADGATGGEAAAEGALDDVAAGAGRLRLPLTPVPGRVAAVP